VLEQGEQAFLSYGDRSNKFLLTYYGFCFADNRYDSFSIKLKMPSRPLASMDMRKMLEFDPANPSQELKLKQN